MYKTILVNRSIEDGEKLVSKLEENKLPIFAAFWHYLDEEMLWRLVIISPLVDMEGPLKTYMRIIKVLNEMGSSVQFGLSDISVMSPSWSQFRNLRRTIEGAGLPWSQGSGPSGASQGMAFEDFYLYRWNLGI